MPFPARRTMLLSTESSVLTSSTKYHSTSHCLSILLTTTTAVQNDVALPYYIARGLYFLAVIFAAPFLFLRISLLSSSFFFSFTLSALVFVTKNARFRTGTSGMW